MNSVSLEVVARVRDAASIEQVVALDVSLERYGSFSRGGSPFVAGDDRSLYILPDAGVFRCVASGFKGDVFVYVQLRRDCGFDSAVRYLAEVFDVSV